MLNNGQKYFKKIFFNIMQERFNLFVAIVSIYFNAFSILQR